MKAYMIMGLAGAGKSTQRQRILDKLGKETKVAIISTDDVVERMCDSIGVTYREGFRSFIKLAEQEVNGLLSDVRQGKYDAVIFDQTNLSAKSRLSKLAKAGLHPKDVELYIITVPFTTIVQRNEARKSFGRDIPENILRAMFDTASSGDSGVDIPHYKSVTHIN